MTVVLVLKAIAADRAAQPRPDRYVLRKALLTSYQALFSGNNK